MSEFRPDWTTPPCDHVLELLQVNNPELSQDDAFSLIQENLGLSDNLMGDFILGDFHLRVEQCKQLADWLGPSPEFWKNLETNHRAQALRLEKVQHFVLDTLNQETMVGKVDQVYDLEKALIAKEFHFVSLVLRKMTSLLSSFPEAVHLSLLTVTLPWHKDLESEREELYEATFKYLEGTKGREYAEESLQGLAS